ncbi:MAG TPA: glucosylceramidase, partial [Parafilimonas sp.]
MRLNKFLLLMIAGLFMMNCSKSSGSNGGGNNNPPPDSSTTGSPTKDTINLWVTSSNQSSLLTKQTATVFLTKGNSSPNLSVDTSTTYQTIDGFGYALTGGSAYVINKLDAATKNNLLQELFGNADNSISIDYLRISIGSSDLNASVFSYDDVAGDTTLSQFSFSKDETDLIPVLKQIVAINSSIKIIATPWSAPTWMKDNDS